MVWIHNNPLPKVIVKQAVLLFLLIALFGLSGNLQAQGWLSIGLPTIYKFSQSENDSFFPVSDMRGTPSGYMIYGSLYDFPFLGYESYTIALDAENAEETAANIKIVFYDIGVRFEQRNTHVLAGYGYGSVNTECELASCSGISFDEGIARQLFIQLGVVLLGDLSFHLSAHRVTGQNDISAGSSSDHFVIDGTLLAFGLKLNW